VGGEALTIVKEAAQIPGLLKEIYGDLAKPGVKQIGNALGTILGLGKTILWPLMLINERTKITLQRNLEKYRRQIQDVPKEQIVPVAPEVGVPISEKLAYVTNEELSNFVRKPSRQSIDNENRSFRTSKFCKSN
jgi:hypothetical protein